MDLQQRQIDELASWLTAAEAKIESNDPVGSDSETIKRQIEEHKVAIQLRKTGFIDLRIVIDTLVNAGLTICVVTFAGT